MQKALEFPNLFYVVPLENYAILLFYDDNISGKIELIHLLNKGVFKKWDNLEFFNNVKLNLENGAIVWGNTIEICPNAMYLKLIGKNFEEWEKSKLEFA